MASAALLFFSPACGVQGGGEAGARRDDAAPISNPEPTTRPNVIFLTVDTLRADHLGQYGYHRDTMPSLTGLGEDGVTFDAAVAPIASTRPSYASMLTGLYPYRHGSDSNWTELHGDVVTLTEVLRAAGYHTAGFVSNFVLIGELSGIDQGFEVFDDQLNEREATRESYERTAGATLAAILRWLDNGPPEPFFLFTNFIDPHGPYTPPERYRQLYPTERMRELPLGSIPAFQRLGGSLNFHDYVDRYDAEIRYVDDALTQLIAALKRKGLWESSLVVFTADHGEAMGGHGVYFKHEYLVWEGAVRVPMVIRLPGRGRAGGGRTSDLASPMDLMPTVLGVTGVPFEGELDGVDLGSVLRGGSLGDRELLIETPRRRGGKGPGLCALQAGGHKLVRAYNPKSGALATERLFDLTADPGELGRVATPATESVRRGMAARFDALVAQVLAHRLGFEPVRHVMPFDDRAGFVRGRMERELSEDQIEQLRSLGYVD